MCGKGHAKQVVLVHLMGSHRVHVLFKVRIESIPPRSVACSQRGRCGGVKWDGRSKGLSRQGCSVAEDE
jgi:hypothetical protein